MSPFLLFVKQGYGKIYNPKNVLQNLLLFLLLVVNLGLCFCSFFCFFVVTKFGFTLSFLFLFLGSYSPLILPFVDRRFTISQGVDLSTRLGKNPLVFFDAVVDKSVGFRIPPAAPLYPLPPLFAYRFSASNTSVALPSPHGLL